jgi:hypothetical protein
MPDRLTLVDFMIEIEMTAVLDECRPRSTAISWNCARPRCGIFDGMNAERILVAQESSATAAGAMQSRAMWVRRIA